MISEARLPDPPDLEGSRRPPPPELPARGLVLAELEGS